MRHVVYCGPETLQIATLKIDQSFVAGIHPERGAQIIKTIVDLAHNLGLRVIAEGVETEEQLYFLQKRKGGCYLLG